jgi:hypothetical protein
LDLKTLLPGTTQDQFLPSAGGREERSFSALSLYGTVLGHCQNDDYLQCDLLEEMFIV